MLLIWFLQSHALEDQAVEINFRIHSDAKASLKNIFPLHNFYLSMQRASSKTYTAEEPDSAVNRGTSISSTDCQLKNLREINVPSGHKLPRKSWAHKNRNVNAISQQYGAWGVLGPAIYKKTHTLKQVHK